MVGWIVISKTNCGIKLKIYSTMFLYSKKGQVIIISMGLLKVEPTYNKGQDSTILNWKSNQHTKEGEIL